MNERMRELAKQAAAIEGWGVDVWQTTYSQEFAKLIVKECGDFTDPVTRKLMFKHFGIEE